MVDINLIIEKALQIVVNNKNILNFPVRNEKSLFCILANLFYQDSSKYTTVT